MLLNYLIISIRNLRKHLTFSIINIVGLGLGLATCLLLVTWILHELSYDRFHANSERLYRASLEYSNGGQVSKTSVSPTALLPALQKSFAEVQNGVRLYNPSYYRPYIVRKDEKVFQETKFYFSDSAFFEIFSFKLLEGSPVKALTEPNSIVLTQSTAKKYFGQEDPIGKLLQINNRTEFKVTGVMEDVPDNSLIQFDFLASFSTLDASRELMWWSANYTTILLLAPNTNIPAFQEKINNLVKKELAAQLTNPKDYVRYPLIKMSDIYLHSDTSESVTTSSIQYVYGFGGISILILIIACINYINLATAKAADRAKEVGIRKVVGAQKKQLLFQFIGESVIITFLAFVLAFILAQITLPIFNSLAGKHFTADVLWRPPFLLYCFAGLVLIAITAGAYPAFAITSFSPLTVLRGTFKNSGRGILLRQSLVVFQFCISIVLIVSTLVILKQITFIQNIRLGYDKENVILLPLDRKTSELYGSLRQQLMSSGRVSQVGRATEAPTNIGGGYTISVQGGDGTGMSITAMDADSTFIPALGMELVAGRNFNDADLLKYRADTTGSFILNETALKELSIAEDKAIGLNINLNGRTGKVIGIVKDFYFASLHDKVGPLAMFNEENQLNYIFVKLKPGDTQESIAAIREICLSTLQHRPFAYEFLDQKYSLLYSSEERIGTIISVFATLAIIIACLGLLGLVAFAAAQRTKEIGIRKVMGATASSIVLLITQNYTRLILIAILLGLPLAWWVMENLFLSSFVYRTDVGFWPYLIAAASCIIVAFVTASYQAFKAAVINPGETLRNE